MEKLILDVLKENNISTYLLTVEEGETAELFFIKKKLDMKRAKKDRRASISVYRDFTQDGKACRGTASCSIDPSNTKEEIDEKIKRAYLAASFVPNEAYELAPAVKAPLTVMKSDMADMPLGDAALKLVQALYSQDTDEKAFVNSAEFFVTRTKRHIINSEGVDVSYVKYSAEGEFVIQCKEPTDVETHQTFNFDNLECEQLAQQAQRAIQTTKDRAVADEMPKTGQYDVILSDKYVSTIIRYYVERSGGAYIYQGYSDFKTSEPVQGTPEQIKGEHLNLTLLPTTPYSDEGIEMKELSLVKDGVLQNIHSGCRFASYLKIKPTGMYSKVSCDPGNVSFEEMKKQPGLHVVNFSDFQMNSLSGNFGGEIRLAYLNDGKTIKPVTGGSINGSIFDAQKDFVFSKETQSNSRFEGPRAILLKGVNVAGA